MYALLKTTVEEPIPPSKNDVDCESIPVINPEISWDLKRKLIHMHIDGFDWKQGGLKSPIKFLDRDSIEYSLSQAAVQNQNEARMARLALEKSLALLDPAWGGVYQYSTQGDWAHPHYEKTMAAQAGCLRVYTLAYSLWHEHRFLLAANCIYDYMKRFLTSPSGAFYSGQTDKIPEQDVSEFFSLNSQQRLRIGIPNVHKFLYTRENGWAIEALATLHEVSGDKSTLQRALRAARWTINHRTLAEGGFRHNEHDRAGPYLGDTLAMGRAMLHLYRVTTEKKWLDYANDAADFINQNFKYRNGGFFRAVDRGEISKPVPQIDENISLTRFANLLFHYTGQPRFRELAKHGLRYLCIPQIATSRQEEAGILLADMEYNEAPVHVIITGKKNNPKARTLFNAALGTYGWYKKIEWLEEGERLPKFIKNKRVIDDHRPAAYVYTEHYGSDPVTNPDTLKQLITMM